MAHGDLCQSGNFGLSCYYFGLKLIHWFLMMPLIIAMNWFVPSCFLHCIFLAKFKLLNHIIYSVILLKIGWMTAFFLLFSLFMS